MSRLLKQSVAVPSAPSRQARMGHWIRRRWLWLTAVGVLVAASLVFLLWPSAQQRYTPDPRSRQFLSSTACVLTGSRGITDPQTAPVWAGVEDASKATGVQGSYLSVPAPDTEASAEPYVNTLALRKCTLLFAVGASEAAAVNARAAAYPSQRFVVIGAGTSAGNIEVIPLDSDRGVRAAVANVIEQAVSGRSAG